VEAADDYAASAGDGDGLDFGELRRFDVHGPTFNGGRVAGLVDRDGLGAGGIDVQGEAAGDALVFHIFGFRHFSFSSFVLTMYGATNPVTCVTGEYFLKKTVRRSGSARWVRLRRTRCHTRGGG